ncbi:MAG TPA: class I SAM-dependent methyltransferase [Mycobacteriales bacterium]|nr:class I SAM-dependent methyltransferase [Mycobacteriales bacterium]
MRLRLTERRLRALVPHGRSVFEIGYGSGALLRRFLDAGWAVGGVDAGQLEVDVDPEVRRRGALTSGQLEDMVPATSAGADPDAAAAAESDGTDPAAAAAAESAGADPDAAEVGAAADGGQYDLVVGVHVLEHLTDPEKGLAAAYRLLRPGGTLALITPTADSAGADWFGAAWWLLEDPTHLRFFSPDSATRSLRRAGFDGVRVRRLALDNLSMEVASLRRRAQPVHRPAGVLPERGTVLSALVTAPITVTARLAHPRLRPSLELTAHRPG